MISRIDIEQRVREWGLREDVVEKDYVIGWVLWGIGRNPVLRDLWAFKGGTSLKKCFVETYRFSEDLDFTVLPGGPVLPDDIQPLIAQVLDDVGQNSGIDFSRREPMLKGNNSGRYTEGRIYYVGPRAAPNVASIKLDLSASEIVVRPTVFKVVSHPYPDLPDPQGTVCCYCFEEVFAEKIRAMGERGRPRDLYDIVNLFRREDLEVDATAVRGVLVEKCRNKGVPVPSLDAILNADTRAELESEWASMLGHQLPELPPLESFLDALAELFGWLEGTTERSRRAPVVPYSSGEDSGWRPPATVRTWGFSAPLETIRFAAVNHLLVELGYGTGTRTIEPYSLRKTKAGDIVLHAIRADSGEHRCYRADRIVNARPTNRSFLPRYAIEFSSFGPLNAPPEHSPPDDAKPARRSSSASTARYTIECPVCRKQFKRSKYGDNRLNKHMDRYGHACPGSGGHGYPV